MEGLPLSNDIIHSRIIDISSNISKQVMGQLAVAPLHFSMPQGENTDFTFHRQLLFVVCHVHADAIQKEL